MPSVDGYRVAAPPVGERVVVKGFSKRAAILSVVAPCVLMFGAFVGGLLLAGEYEGSDWTPIWLVGWLMVGIGVFSAIRRTRPHYLVEIDAHDVRLLDVRGMLIGSVRAGTLAIHAGSAAYTGRYAVTFRMPALVLVGPGVELTLHAGTKAPGDQVAPDWPFAVPAVRRPRHAVPLAAFEALRWRRTDVPRG